MYDVYVRHGSYPFKCENFSKTIKQMLFMRVKTEVNQIMYASDGKKGRFLIGCMLIG